MSPFRPLFQSLISSEPTSKSRSTPSSPSSARRGAPGRTAALAVAAVLLTSCGPIGHGSPGSGGGSSGPPGPGASASADAPAPGARAAGGGALPVGAGPQAAYTVRPQPPAGSCHFRYTEDKQPLPDASCTPGATNPRVTQANLASTICRGGYTSDIRPPASITGREKAANAKSYGYTRSLHDAEYDHLVSLELGGDPNDPRNLWVEPPSPGHRAGSGPDNDKDGVESALHSAVCSRKATLAAAQHAIATDWTTAESVLGLKRDRAQGEGVDAAGPA